MASKKQQFKPNGDHAIHMTDIQTHKNPQYKNGRSNVRATKKEPPPPEQEACLSNKQCICVCVIVVLGVIVIILAAAGYGLYRTGVLNNLLGIEEPVLKYPTLACPSDITYPTTTVSYKAPTPFDFPGSPPPDVSCTPASGSTFTAGATTVVKCAAEDRKGNTATCRFHVTVDQSSLAIICPADITSQASIVTWLDPQPYNFPKPPFVACLPPSGSKFEAGTMDVVCYADDNEGNLATCTFTVAIDQQRPEITCPQDMTVPSNPVVYDNPFVSDDIDTDLTLSCDRPSGSVFLANFATEVSCTVRDDANNAASCSFTVVVDSIFPTIVCPVDFTATSNPVEWSENVRVHDNLDTSVFFTCEPESGASFPNGPNLVDCTAYDDAGNTDSCSFHVTLSSDQERPSITCPAHVITTSNRVVSWQKPAVMDNVDTNLQVVCVPESGSTFDVGETTVVCTVTDDSGLSDSCEFNVLVDLQPPSISCPSDVITATQRVFWNDPFATDNSNLAPTVSCEPASGASFPIGAFTTVRCTATDATGNSASCEFKVVVDQTAPPITCPQNIITRSSVVSYPDPVVTDNVDANPTVQCSPPSGSVFFIGRETIVTCTTRDSAGFSNTCTFSVTVDQTPPTVICPASMVVSTPQVSWTDPPVFDNIDINPPPSVSCNPPSGSTFTEAQTSIRCTATDRAGNEAWCSFMISTEEQDQIKPTIQCPADIMVSTATVSWSDLIVSDNIDTSLTATCSPSSGSIFTDGQNTVLCATTDSAGNSATCSFNVVVDREKPSITCPSDRVVTFDRLFWVEPVTSDNLDVAPSVTCDPPSGSTFTTGVTTVTCDVVDDVGNSNSCSFTVTRGGCGAIPTTAAKCTQLLTTTYNDYDMTLFPNSAGDGNAADAVTRFNSLAFTNCNPNAELFLCAQLFPDCPGKGWTRHPCRQLCQAVRTDCEAAYNAAFPGSPWAWDCNDFYDTGAANELCLHPEGDFLDTGICGTQPAVTPGGARIVNGINAAAGKWPFIGSLRGERNDHRCGASVLNEHWAITAAHCIGKTRTMVLGDVIKDQPSQYHVTVEFSAIITHPQYDTTSYRNDLALLRFKEPIAFNDYIRPICLATLVEELDHYTGCYGIGWGRLTYKGESPEHLQEVDLPLWTYADCRANWGSTVNTNNICLGVAPEDSLGKGTCQGDSGGPLICRGQDDNRWHLVGVVSFGPSGACAQDSPNVGVRVTQFYDWIDEQINGPSANNFVDCSQDDVYKCSSYSGDICILQSSVCDLTVYECPRREDELNCHNSCGTTSFTLTGIPGGKLVFKSPNYDDLFPDYPSVMFCQWEFTAPADKVILVEFNTFDLEEDDDYVYVGTATGVGPEGRIFSHTGNVVPDVWVSTGNVVTLAMDTYKSNDGEFRGFQATLTAVDPGDYRNPAYLDTSVCGSRPSILPQISGGTETTEGWPWMGSIRLDSGLHYCGITLLDSEWAITTRSCIDSGRIAVFGDHTTSNPPTVTTHVESQFCGIFVHPEYYITLIKLCTPVTFNSQVAPACLHTAPTEIQDYAMGTNEVTPRCRILGWGRTSSSGSNVDTLREVEVNLASDNCGYSTNYLCVQDTAASTAGSCPGDSGGPLLCVGDDDKWRVVAVILNTYCEEEGAKHPFIRLSSFQTFISETITIDADCDNLGSKCVDGRCYLPSGRCNGYYECLGKEDEANCDASCRVVGENFDQQIILVDQPSQSITISSANYPDQYDDDIDCLWFFTAPAGSTIKFTLLNFRTEGGYDFVRIGSGSNHVSQQLHELSGRQTTPVTYNVQANVAWMTFSTDESTTQSGFQIQVSFD